jgi:microcystin-dependent protein
MFITSNDYLGSIMTAAFNFAPKGYALCNGQTLAINTNTALFSLLGTTFGGNGTTTFLLPNLQGRATLGAQGSSTYTLGQVGGADSVTLTVNNIPAHTHTVSNVSISAPTGASATQASPVGGYFAPNPSNADRFGPGTDEQMAVTPFSDMTASGTYTTGNTGGSQPYDKRMPYTTINFCISLVGIFPSRS